MHLEPDRSVEAGRRAFNSLSANLAAVRRDRDHRAGSGSPDRVEELRRAAARRERRVQEPRGRPHRGGGVDGRRPGGGSRTEEARARQARCVDRRRPPPVQAAARESPDRSARRQVAGRRGDDASRQGRHGTPDRRGDQLGRARDPRARPPGRRLDAERKGAGWSVLGVATGRGRRGNSGCCDWRHRCLRRKRPHRHRPW